VNQLPDEKLQTDGNEMW